MCGRFDTTHLYWRDIHEQLSSLIPVATAPINLEPNGDVRPTTQQLVARREGEGADARWALEKMRWSLVPFWRNGKPLKDTEKGMGDGFNLTTFNCKVENFFRLSDADEEPKRPATFREAFKARRCIVPASGWYEWTGPAGAKVKHRFTRADGGIIWFAGMWDRCATPDAGEVRSFTILTGPSAGGLAEYHDRAPVILERDEWATWLDPEGDATALVRAVRPERFAVGAA
ncbi:MAG: SOS response-associated peptidase [Phenylobacterium sp.]